MTPTTDLELYRGDTWSQTITGLGDLTGATDIWLSAKNDPDDTEDQAVLRIRMTVGLERINGAAGTPANGSVVTVAPLTDGTITVTLAAVEAAKLTPDDVLLYDVQKKVGVVVTTPRRGRLFVTRDITRAV